MKKCVVTLLSALLLASVVLAQRTPIERKKDEQSQLRSLQGQVMGHQDAPLNQAIVYLKNTKTLAVRTYIADNNGQYQFNGLAPNVDYEVHAEYDGQKSDVKTLSSFDSRAKALINLHIDVNKK